LFEFIFGANTLKWKATVLYEVKKQTYLWTTV